MAQLVKVEELKQQRDRGAMMLLVDVRSGSEYGTGHVPGAVNIPLEQVESRVGDLGTQPVVLICKSGKRARMAAGLLEPRRNDVAVLEGGTDAWRKGNLPLVASLPTRWSLERQVRLGAGLIALVGAVLALTLEVRWAYLSALVGLGLTMAGLTDFCPMALVMGKMPWNGPRTCPEADSHGGTCCG